METFLTYPLEFHDIVIEEKTYRLAMVKNAWDLLDRISVDEFQRDEKMPYWAEIWPGGIVLCKYLLSLRLPKGKNILEIGAGVGPIAAIMGANGYRCIATDYDDDALQFCLLNAKLNQAENFVQATFLDWRYPNLKEKFDLIVGSDIVYEVRNLLPILDIVRLNLASGGTFYFSDPGRRPMDHFKVLIREAGYHLKDVYSEYFEFRHTKQTVTVYALTQYE